MRKSTETDFVGFSATVNDFETMVQFLETDGNEEMKTIVNRLLKNHSEDIRDELKEREVFIKANPFCSDLIEVLPVEAA